MRCADEAVEAAKIILEDGKLTWNKYSAEMKGILHDPNLKPGYLTRLHWEGSLALTRDIAEAKAAASAKIAEAEAKGDDHAATEGQNELDVAKQREASLPPEYHMAAAFEKVFKDKGVTSRFLEQLDNDGENTILSKLANDEELTPGEKSDFQKAFSVAEQAAKDARAENFTNTAKFDAMKTRQDLSGIIKKNLDTDTLPNVRSAHEILDTQLNATLKDAKPIFDDNVSAETRDKLATKGYDSLAPAEKTEVEDAFKQAKAAMKPNERTENQPHSVKQISNEVDRQKRMATARTTHARTAAGKSNVNAPKPSPEPDVDWHGLTATDAYKAAVKQRNAENPVKYATKRLADKYGKDKAEQIIQDIGEDQFSALVNGRNLPKDFRNGIDRVLHTAELERRAESAPEKTEVPQAVQDAIDKGKNAVDQAIEGTITPEENVTDIMASHFHDMPGFGEAFREDVTDRLNQLPVDASADVKAKAIADSLRAANREVALRLGWFNNLARNLRLTGITTLAKVFTVHGLQNLLDTASLPLRAALDSVNGLVLGTPGTTSLIPAKAYVSAFVNAYSGFGHDTLLGLRQGNDVALISRVLRGDPHAMKVFADDFHAETTHLDDTSPIKGAINTSINFMTRTHGPAFDAVGRWSYAMHMKVLAEVYAKNAANKTRIGADILAAKKPGDLAVIPADTWNEYGQQIKEKSDEFIANPPAEAQAYAYAKANDDIAYAESKHTTNRNDTGLNSAIKNFTGWLKRREIGTDRFGTPKVNKSARVARGFIENWLMFSKVTSASAKAMLDASGFGAVEGAGRAVVLRNRIKAADRTGNKVADSTPGLTPEGRSALVDAYKSQAYTDEDIRYMTRVTARGVIGFTSTVLVAKYLYDKGMITPSYGASTEKQKKDKSRPPGSISLHPNDPNSWHRIEQLPLIGALSGFAGFFNAGWLSEPTAKGATTLGATTGAASQFAEELPYNMTETTISKALENEDKGKSAARLAVQPFSIPALNQGAKALDHNRDVEIRTDKFEHTLADTVQSNTPGLRNLMDDKHPPGRPTSGRHRTYSRR